MRTQVSVQFSGKLGLAFDSRTRMWLTSHVQLDLGIPAKPKVPSLKAPVGPEFPELNPKLLRRRKVQEAVVICERVFWESGSCPTPEKFLELSGYRNLKQVNEMFESEDFIEALLTRGLHPAARLGSLREALTVEQMVAINVMLNPMDQRSERAKIDTVNELLQSEGMPLITMFKWNTWRRSPAFQQFLLNRANEMFKSADYKWYQALEQQVANGDVQAMKLFAQARGINLDPERVQIQIDISSTVSALFEILAEFVAPQVLTMIGERLDEHLRKSTSGAIEVSTTQSLDSSVQPSSEAGTIPPGSA